MPKLTIVQMSDIHLGDSSSDPIWSKIPSLVARIAESAWDAEVLLLALVGDITDKGLPAEFASASTLIATIREDLASRLKSVPILCLAVPGNHDNTFSDPTDVRDALLVTLDAPRVGSQLFEAISGVQHHFNTFARQIESPQFSPQSWEGHISRTAQLHIGDRVVSLSLINTSWACRKRDTYGSPRLSLRHTCDDRADLSIAIMHHPPAWTSPSDNAVYGRQLHDDHSLILTGHIHEDADRSILDNIAGTQTRHVQSGCLQDRADPLHSTFRIITFDSDSLSLDTVKYSWDGSTYSREPEQDPLRTRTHASRRAGLSPAFAAYLDEPGMSLRHRKAKTLTLPSLYVRPRLARQDVSDAGASVVRGEAILDELIQAKRSIINGPESCGKTSLAKMLVRALLDRDLFPVLLHAECINIRGGQDVAAEILKVVDTEYSPSSARQVRDAQRSQRVVIIDDIHKIARRDKSRADLLSFAHQFAEIVVVVSPDNFVADDFMNRGLLAASLTDYVRYSILPFSSKLRYQLVEKWFLLGAELEDEDAIDRLRKDIELAARTITGVLEKEYMPSFPTFVLALLQNLDSTDPSRSAGTSYGHLFEAMIYQRLGVPGADGAADVELRVNYCANLAYSMMLKEQRSIGIAELDDWHHDFCKTYLRKVSKDAMMRDLESASVIRRTADSLSFSYPYLMYFFIAKFLAVEIETDSTRTVIKRLIDGIHRDDFSHILLCLCHLSKNTEIFRMVQDKIDSIMPEVKPFDVTRDSGPIDEFLDTVSDFVLASSQDDRKRIRDRLLDSDDGAAALRARVASREVEDDASMMQLIQELNGSYRAIQIVGQILKSSASTLKGPQKEQLTKGAIILGLKALAVFVSYARSDVDIMVENYKVSVSEEDKSADAGQVTARVRARILGLLRSYGVGVLKHVSTSMGSRHLEPVFDRVRKSGDPVSSLDLAVLAIELDHYVDFPMSGVERVYESLRKSKYGASIVKCLVWLHLVCFSVKFDIRQRACSAVGISLEERVAVNPMLKRRTTSQSQHN